MEDRILRDIKNLFEHEEEVNYYYYNPVRISKFWSISYIEYKSNSNNNKKHYQLKNILIKF